VSELRATRPTSWLPEGFTEAETVVDEVVADGVALGRAGLCVMSPAGEAITGSAAGPGAPPLARARHELHERIATLEAIRGGAAAHTLRDRTGSFVALTRREVLFPESPAPEVWRHARSNGTALHDDWATACDRAFWELCERDRVLRAWYGLGSAHAVTAPLEGTPLGAATSYDWEVASFHDDAGDPSEVAVVGVFGFPRVAHAPLVTGFGARPHVADAMAAAVGEALQQLAFLWGEAIPVEAPERGPTALHHVEALLWPGTHAALRAWLRHGHGHLARGCARPRPLRAADGFVDLTPAWLRGEAVVVRAVAQDAMPMTFGPGPLSAHLPPALQLHPMP